MKRLYGEGTWFAVPLENGKYSIGIVARSGKHKLLGYFFGPAINSPPQLDEAASHTASRAVFVKMFSDLGLHEGSWPIIGYDPSFDSECWPVPDVFFLADAFGGLPWAVTYSEDLEETSRYRINLTEAESLPSDGFAGSVFIEKKLSSLLGATG